MSTTPFKVDKKWFQEKMAANNVNMTKVSEAFGIHKSGVSKIFNGYQRLKNDEAAVLARMINEPLSDVLAKAGVKGASELPKGAHKLKISGSVHSNGEVIRDRKKQPSVLKPPAATDNTQAVRFDTSSTPLSPFHGAVVYYEQEPTVADNAVDRYCIISDENNKEFLAFVKRGPNPFEFECSKLGFEDTEFIRLSTASPVTWIKMP